IAPDARRARGPWRSGWRRRRGRRGRHGRVVRVEVAAVGDVAQLHVDRLARAVTPEAERDRAARRGVAHEVAELLGRGHAAAVVGEDDVALAYAGAIRRAVARDRVHEQSVLLQLEALSQVFVGG